MKKDVNITLISRQFNGEEREEIELLTEGTLSHSGGVYEISYKETEATGFEGSVTKLSLISSSKIILTRRGSASSDMIIELGKKHHCHYETPYGDFMVGVTAKAINSDVSENGGKLSFCYVIDVNSSYLGDYEIKIDIAPLD